MSTYKTAPMRRASCWSTEPEDFGRAIKYAAVEYRKNNGENEMTKVKRREEKMVTVEGGEKIRRYVVKIKPAKEL